jgi:uncharacterized membrane protein YfcA
MTPEITPALLAAIFAMAMLFSSVGHGGSSGYIAVMSLFALAPAFIKPTALALNILVASIGTLQFLRAGYFSFALFWPFALLAAPLAFFGGAAALPARAFKLIVGAVLLFAAARLVIAQRDAGETHLPPRPAAIASGGAISVLAGLTGTGGGIFLTPLLLFFRWANLRTAAAVSAPFILLNSVAGLAGNFAATREFPVGAFALAGVAGIGGAIGSYLGSKRLAPPLIRQLLALVLAIAGVKLLFT